MANRQTERSKPERQKPSKGAPNHLVSLVGGAGWGKVIKREGSSVAFPKAKVVLVCAAQVSYGHQYY